MCKLTYGEPLSKGNAACGANSAGDHAKVLHQRRTPQYLRAHMPIPSPFDIAALWLGNSQCLTL